MYLTLLTLAALATGSIDAIVRQEMRGERHGRYAVARADLNGDSRREIIVYMESPNLCGTGGCVALVLTPTATGYKRVMRTTVTWLPICRLATQKDGWSDLGVGVAGEGIRSAFARLRFNGRRYPSNPSIEPRVARSQCSSILILRDANLRTVR